MQKLESVMVLSLIIYNNFAEMFVGKSQSRGAQMSCVSSPATVHCVAYTV